VKAYVLIQTWAHKESVVKALRAIPGIVSAQGLRGPYDAIAIARSASAHHSIAGIVAEVRSLPGVMRAIPATVVDSLAHAHSAELSLSGNEAA
jgi:hypothetical protein